MPRHASVPEELARVGFASWSALAAALGIDRHVLSHMRAGRRPITSAMTAKIAATLNIPGPLVGLLMGGRRK